MEDLANLLSIFGKIPITNKTLIFSFLLIVGILGYKFLDDRKFRKYYDDMKSEKNKEIERLADDNRRYRDIYLKSIGIDQNQINVMSAADMNGG